jgi:hypothetical protein
MTRSDVKSQPDDLDALKCVANSSEADPEDLSSLFDRNVAQLLRVAPWLDQTTEEARLVRSLVARVPTIRLDYEVWSDAFNRAFLFKNLFKSLIAVDQFLNRLRKDTLAVDVGTGAGVFALAFASSRPRGVASSVCLVDSSLRQLHLAAQLLPTSALRKWRAVHAEYEFTEFAPERLRLFSYWFCEQRIERSLGPSANWPRLMGHRGVIVDYKEVVGTVQSLTSADYDWQVIENTTRLLERHSRLIRDNAITTHAAYYERRACA